MKVIGSILTWVMKKRIHQIELFMKYPHEVQEEWRRKLLNTARNTEIGKKYDFESITSEEEFKSRVPVQNYDQIKDYIDRLLKGEQNLLWPSEVKWFAKSSGTTSDKSKFIPVTQEALEECHFKGGKDMLSIFCNNRPDNQIFSGKALMMGGSNTVNQMNPDSFYGDLSAVIMKNLPFWADMLRTPEKKVALMEDWEEKIDRMAKEVAKEDVTNISGIPTWTMVLARRILEDHKTDNLLDIWPNLELYLHGAVSFKPYREQFKSIIPSDKMYYLETYNASEGFFGIQDFPNSEELLLMLDYGIYYEFIPIDQAEEAFPTSYNLSQVELNTNYVIVITTNAGLWRYRIGDTIKFTNLNPYRIQISGRTKHFINAFGEELIIDNAEQALRKACSETGAVIKDYTAGPVYFSEEGAKGCHEWLIEFVTEPKNLERFTEILDQGLKASNTDYHGKRKKDMALTMPKVHSVPKDTFYNWLKSRGKLGGQHKVPRLANDRKYLDPILDLIK